MRDCETVYDQPKSVAFSIDRILGLDKEPFKTCQRQTNDFYVSSRNTYENLQTVKETSDDCKTPSPRHHYPELHSLSPLKDNSWFQNSREAYPCTPRSPTSFSSFERVSRMPSSCQPWPVQRPFMKEFLPMQRHERIPSIQSYEHGMMINEKARISRHYPNSYSNPDDSNLDAGRKGGQVRFTHGQSIELERVFVAQKYISPQERKQLANLLQLSERQVKTWFQNRRAKWRRLKMEAEMRKRLSNDNRQHFNRKNSDSDAESDCSDNLINQDVGV